MLQPITFSSQCVCVCVMTADDYKLCTLWFHPFQLVLIQHWCLYEDADAAVE